MVFPHFAYLLRKTQLLVRSFRVSFRNECHFKKHDMSRRESCGWSLQSSFSFAFRSLPQLQLPSAGMKSNFHFKKKKNKNLRTHLLRAPDQPRQSCCSWDDPGVEQHSTPRLTLCSPGVQATKLLSQQPEKGSQPSLRAQHPATPPSR